MQELWLLGASGIESNGKYEVGWTSIRRFAYGHGIRQQFRACIENWYVSE